jgi:hypothetical protein
MIEITIKDIPPSEYWDEQNQMFVEEKGCKGQTLRLEHSLVSLQKWESKWCKSFLSKKEKTYEETVDYIKCMTLTQNVNPDVYKGIDQDHIDKINEYIKAPMTASYLPESPNKPGSREAVTAELIYFWMITLNIPFECRKWHLNQLLSLIRVCERKNQPPKQMGKGELARRNHSLNAARRKKYNTRG